MAVRGRGCAPTLEAESRVKGLDFVLLNPPLSLHPVSINLDLSARAKHSSSVIHPPRMHISTFVCDLIRCPWESALDTVLHRSDRIESCVRRAIITLFKARHVCQYGSMRV